DWDLVELLLNACREWSVASTRNGNFLADKTIIGVVDMGMIEMDLDIDGGYDLPAPYPIDADDFYYFENVPYLIEIGVYPESLFNRALSHIAFMAVDWEITKFEDIVDKLMSFGAVVTPSALYSASLHKDYFCGATPRFRFLLGRYELNDSSPKFDHWENVLSSINDHGDTKVLHLLLERGVVVTEQALLTALGFCKDMPMQPGMEELFKAVKPGDPLLHGLFDNIDENTFAGDLYGENFDSVFEMMEEVGFRTTEIAVERAIAANLGNLACFMKRLDIIDKLIDLGAVVTSEALYYATFQAQRICQVTPRFKLLLEKYEPDCGTQFTQFKDLLSSIRRNGDVKVLHLLLDRGVFVTTEALWFALQGVNYGPMVPGVEELFKAVKPGNPLLHRFFDELDQSMYPGDLYGDNFQSVFEMMRELGFRTTEATIERMITENRPNIARLMKRLIEKS
ncbi:hypothetical protein HDU99_010932, partial [Rhizoclosmatium hyalinum]